MESRLSRLQGLLGRLLLGDVVGDPFGLDDCTCVVAYGAAGRQDRNRGTVLAGPFDLDCFHVAKGNELSEQSPTAGRITVNVARDVSRQEFFLGVVAQHGDQRLIDFRKLALDVGPERTVRGIA